MRTDPIGLLLRLARDHGEIAHTRLLNRHVVLLSDPEHVRHVFQDNYRNYSKQTRGFHVLRSFLANGLLTSEGDEWLRQRRIAQPGFHRDRIAAFGRTMTHAATELADRWETDGVSTIDVTAEMTRLTLRIVGETLLSTDVSRTADRVGQALTVALRAANRAITRVIEIPAWLPTPGNRRLQTARATLDEIVYDMIDRRRRGGHPAEDLLSMLMEARDEESGEQMSDTQLRDEVMTIFLAGHETTALALGWTWLLLSRYPAARRRLQAELTEVLSGRPPEFNDLRRLGYVEQVVKESLRLFPPAWIISRNAIRPDQIGGYDIPAGTIIFASPYVTHRLPRLWDNPEGFDPDRFAPDANDTRPPFAYFPFGGGPRQCIGNSFAMMELVLVVATLAQRCDLDLAAGQAPGLQPSITLRPTAPIAMERRPVTAPRGTQPAPALA